MPNLSNDFEVRKETLRALGGDPTGLANIYEVDLEILKLIGSGGGGIDWDTIKQKLAEDGVESIKFTMGNEEVILTASELKTLLNQTVLPDAPMDGKQYARQNGAWTVVESGGSVTHEGKYMTITVDKSNSGETVISPTVTGSLPNLNLQYRINNGSWNDFIVGTTPDIHVVAGDFVQFKGNNPDGFSMGDSNYMKFAISGNPVHLSGNVMSLLDGVGDTLVIPNSFCFSRLFIGSNVKTVSSDFLPATELTLFCYYVMFSGCTSLVTAPELPATTLSFNCYGDMFNGCSSLKQSPGLPALTLAEKCYDYMFSGCTSLVTPPELPATTLANSCYSNMFRNCKSLVQAPALPATTLANYCYTQMFIGCSSLTQAPELPATTLAKGCYHTMFESCTNLVTAPELPATTLANYCYTFMFRWCNILTQAPALPATTLAEGCYGSMFDGCTKLSYIKSMATEGTINADGTVPSALENWMSNVSSTGTLEKPSEAVYVTNSTGGIPSGWTTKDIAEYTEAPKDGNQYARQDGTWVEVSKVKTTSNNTLQFWNGTQAEYDAIATKDANTLYIIS